MSDRKYSVAEIDRMREDIGRMFPLGVAYDPDWRARQIEDKLRTYMLNGTDPDELAAESDKYRAADIEWFIRNHEIAAQRQPPDQSPFLQSQKENEE